MTNHPTTLPPLTDEDARTLAQAYGVPLETVATYERGRYQTYLDQDALDDTPEALVRFRRIELHLAKSYPLLLRRLREEGDPRDPRELLQVAEALGVTLAKPPAKVITTDDRTALYDLARNPPDLSEADRAWLAGQIGVDPGDAKDATQVVCITPRAHAYKYVEEEVRELMCDVNMDYGGSWELDPSGSPGSPVRGKTLREAVDRLQAQAKGEVYDAPPDGDDKDELPVEAVAALHYVQSLEEKIAEALAQRPLPLFSVRQKASKAAEKANRRYQEYVADRQREGLPVQVYWDYVVDAALLAISTESGT